MTDTKPIIEYTLADETHVMSEDDIHRSLQALAEIRAVERQEVLDAQEEQRLLWALIERVRGTPAPETKFISFTTMEGSDA